MRHAQDGVFGIEEVNLAVAVRVYSHVKDRWFELHEADRSRRGARNLKKVPFILFRRRQEINKLHFREALARKET